MGDCSNGIEIEIKIECGAITTKDFELTEMQLELGSKASEFNYRRYIDELTDCLRYYWNSAKSNPVSCGAIAFSAAALELCVRYPVPMAKVASGDTIKIYNGGTVNQVRNTTTGGAVTFTPTWLGLSYYGACAVYDLSNPFTAGAGYDFDIKVDAEL